MLEEEKSEKDKISLERSELKNVNRKKILYHKKKIENIYKYISNTINLINILILYRKIIV